MDQDQNNQPAPETPETSPAAAATPGPTMDVVAPPPAPAPPAEPAADKPAETAPVPAKPAPRPAAPKPPKQPGVTLAIVATIIIVVALAILATYAYLHQK